MKAAGDPVGNDGLCLELPAQAAGTEQRHTSPAADVCEWQKLGSSWGFKTSCSTKWLMNENYGGDICPLCKKLIEYKVPTP